MANFDLGTSIEVFSDTGISGVFSSTTKLADFIPKTNSAFSIQTTTVSGSTSVSITNITNSLIGSNSIDWDSVVNTSGDDVYNEVSIPFSIQYLGTTYNSVWIGSNFYITFGSGSSVFNGLSASVPSLPKIMISAADRSYQRYFVRTRGEVGSRITSIRVEGTNATSGLVGLPNMIYEVNFNESIPNKIDLHIGTMVTLSSFFTTPIYSPFTYLNSSVLFQPTTATALITPTFSSVNRIDDPTIPVDLGNLLTGLTKPVAMNTPRRPSSGQLYPRGNQ